MHNHDENCNHTPEQLTDELVEKLDNTADLSQLSDLAKMVQLQVDQVNDARRRFRNKRKAERRVALNKAVTKEQRRLAKKTAGPIILKPSKL